MAARLLPVDDVWCRLTTVVSDVRRLLEVEVHGRTGLVVTDCEVLAAAGAPPQHRATMTELGEAARLSPSGVTRAVSRLAALGLIERRRDRAADSRLLYVSLTPAGGERLAEALAARRAVLARELLPRLPALTAALVPDEAVPRGEAAASLDR